MAIFPKSLEVPFESELRCPVCENPIAVVAIVDITAGAARRAGTAGFRSPILTVNIESQIKGIRINHSCDYKKPEVN